MREISLGKPIRTEDDRMFRQWVLACMAEIERASYDDIAAVANDFTTSNVTETRTLDASTATASDVANVLCTFIEDLKKRGMKRSQ